MKRFLTGAICLSVLFAGCDTYAGSGAYMGSSLGSILGSAIGGISDGPRGSDIGTLVGMAGGAVLGGAIGNAQDKKRQADMGQYRHDRTSRMGTGTNNRRVVNGEMEVENGYGSGFDETNSGDDRIYDFTGSDYTNAVKGQMAVPSVSAGKMTGTLKKDLKVSSGIEIRNARFIDSDGDNAIGRGEMCKVIFEVMNRGAEPVYDIQPTVVETTGNRHLFISPGIHVESISPGQGIRYTALVKADNRLKNGTVKICVSVVQGAGNMMSAVSEFNIPTLGR